MQAAHKSWMVEICHRVEMRGPGGDLGGAATLVRIIGQAEI